MINTISKTITLLDDLTTATCCTQITNAYNAYANITGALGLHLCEIMDSGTQNHSLGYGLLKKAKVDALAPAIARVLNTDATTQLIEWSEHEKAALNISNGEQVNICSFVYLSPLTGNHYVATTAYFPDMVGKEQTKLIGTLSRQFCNTIANPGLMPCEDLTPRQQNILSFSSLGMTYVEISKELDISTRTVKFHLKNTYKRLGVTNKQQAIRIAAQRGLISF